MLQQTTVATVGPYFTKFIARWPTLNSLAAAPLEDVLHAWAGLGYYRRARLLHECAKLLHTDHGGVFPQDEAALRALPGFGPYTAAAVRAIAFDKPATVVDGNVERVMARIFALTESLPKAKKALRAAAASLAPEERAGDYAQALMDLGATVCTPRVPKCGLCPWQDCCLAYAQKIQETLPSRAERAAKPVRRTIAFVLFSPKGELLIRRRPPQGLLAEMMEVPSSPWQEGALPSIKAVARHAPYCATWQRCDGLVTHIFTHFKLEIAVVVGRGSGKEKGVWISPTHIDREALPSVMKKIIQHATEGGRPRK